MQNCLLGPVISNIHLHIQTFIHPMCFAGLVLLKSCKFSFLLFPSKILDGIISRWSCWFPSSPFKNLHFPLCTSLTNVIVLSPQLTTEKTALQVKISPRPCSHSAQYTFKWNFLLRSFVHYSCISMKAKRILSWAFLTKTFALICTLKIFNFMVTHSSEYLCRHG